MIPAGTITRTETCPETVIMKTQISLLAGDAKPRPDQTGPSCLARDKRQTLQLRATADGPRSAPDYAQARRQGLYQAACIIDEVEDLQERDPERIFHAIRARLSELVRGEL